MQYLLYFDEFDIYSYNKVIFYNINNFFVAGDVGVLIEFSYSNEWIAYKRKIYRDNSNNDDVILVNNINDMFLTSWNKINSLTYYL